MLALLSNPQNNIDPNYKSCMALQIACWKGDLALLQALLRHPLLHPQIAMENPMHLAIIGKNGKCVLELLGDPRFGLDLYANSLRRLMKGSMKFVISGLNRKLLDACAMGNNDLIRCSDLSRFSFHKFDVLLGRARNYPSTIREIRQAFLHACHVPSNQHGRILNFMARLSPMRCKEIYQVLKERAKFSLISASLDPNILDEIACHFRVTAPPSLGYTMKMRLLMYSHSALYLQLFPLSALSRSVTDVAHVTCFAYLMRIYLPLIWRRGNFTQYLDTFALLTCAYALTIMRGLSLILILKEAPRPFEPILSWLQKLLK